MNVSELEVCNFSAHRPVLIGLDIERVQVATLAADAVTFKLCYAVGMPEGVHSMVGPKPTVLARNHPAP